MRGKNHDGGICKDEQNAGCLSSRKYGSGTDSPCALGSNEGSSNVRRSKSWCNTMHRNVVRWMDINPYSDVWQLAKEYTRSRDQTLRDLPASASQVLELKHVPLSPAQTQLFNVSSRVQTTVSMQPFFQPWLITFSSLDLTMPGRWLLCVFVCIGLCVCSGS